MRVESLAQEPEGKRSLPLLLSWSKVSLYLHQPQHSPASGTTVHDGQILV